MQDSKYDVNFLRFLTKSLSLGIFDHNIAQSLSICMGMQEIKKEIREYFKANHQDSSRNLNIYIHIPYCTELCSYCHCNAVPLKSQDEFSEYLKFLNEQIRIFSALTLNKKISSIWLGGGTPSLLSERDIREIFENIYNNFKCKDKIQVNFEAAPSSLTRNKIKILKEYGLNRLSLGVQSLDEKVLKEANRAQNKKMFYDCINWVRKEKVAVLNIDLIAGLPFQSISSFLSDLYTVIKLRPEIIHINPFSDISTSRYYRKRKFDIHEFVKRRHIMILEAKKILANSGYKKYGFEAYQLDGQSHNFQQLDTVNNFSNIMAFGEEALSVIFDKLIYKCINWECVSSGKDPEFKGFLIDESYRKAKFMILYLWNGFDREYFYRLFGEDVLSSFSEELSFLGNLGLVKVYNDTIRYISNGSIEELFDYFSYTHIFYKEDIILALKKHFKKIYNPKYDYNFLYDGFLPKINDHSFMLTYYGMGY